MARGLTYIHTKGYVDFTNKKSDVRKNHSFGCKFIHKNLMHIKRTFNKTGGVTI